MFATDAELRHAVEQACGPLADKTWWLARPDVRPPYGLNDLLETIAHVPARRDAPDTGPRWSEANRRTVTERNVEAATREESIRRAWEVDPLLRDTRERFFGTSAAPFADRATLRDWIDRQPETGTGGSKQSPFRGGPRYHALPAGFVADGNRTTSPLWDDEYGPPSDLPFIVASEGDLRWLAYAPRAPSSRSWPGISSAHLNRPPCSF